MEDGYYFRNLHLFNLGADRYKAFGPYTTFTERNSASLKIVPDDQSTFTQNIYVLHGLSTHDITDWDAFERQIAELEERDGQRGALTALEAAWPRPPRINTSS